MTRDQKIKIAMVVCVVVLLCTVIISTTGLFSGGSTIFGYANADKYRAGETEITGEVKNLDINWTSGKVKIAYHAGSTVDLQETAPGSLNGDQQMHWWLDGDTLRVQYAASGIRLNIPVKELTVMLPEGIQLDEVKISATSADILVPSMKAKKLDLGSTSGDITAEAEAEEVKLGSTSGDITMNLAGRADKVEAGSTSGKVRIETESVKKLEAGSTSGNVEIRAAKSEKVKIGSTSGSVRVTLLKMEELSVSTTSGSVTAAVPAEPGFKADISTVSGGVDTSLALERHGSTYTCGDGSGKITIGTVSGSIRIEEAR